MAKLSIAVLAALCLALPVSASARPVATGDAAVERIDYPGLKRLKYRYGPLQINPGQNSIQLSATDLHPKRPGYITRFEPNLVRAKSGQPLPVALMHIHHGVWLLSGKPTFAAGEEKTILQAPRGFGVEVDGQEKWTVNYMLHNLISRPESVYLTWYVDFVPKSAPSGIRGSFVRWMDVAGTKVYPVFDALRGWGENGRYTFPDQAEGKERDKIGEDSRWEVGEDVTLVYSVGHLHPGTLYTTMYATRNGVKRRLFRSKAKYFDSGSPNSWDMSVASTSPGWRVKLRRGDVVTVSATVDTSSASWRESMGIMPPLVYRGHDAGGVDPFRSPGKVPQRGVLSHGSLPENRVPGGASTGAPDPRSLPDGPRLSGPVAIRGFRYGVGDLESPSARPPVVSPGQSLSFVNLDAPSELDPDRSAYHTVTACKAPCTQTSGSNYPLEDGPHLFDSGQLGFGPLDQTPAANRNSWSTPASLSPGTYTFFCRIHPDMRGAFRVKNSPDYGVATGWPTLP